MASLLFGASSSALHISCRLPAFASNPPAGAPLSLRWRCPAAVPLARRRLVSLPSSSASVPTPDGSSSSSFSSDDGNGAAQRSAAPEDSSSSSNGTGAAPAPEQVAAKPGGGGFFGWLVAQQRKSAELRTRLASLGLAAVLSYGLFDGVSYTIAFSLAFLGYEAQTGLNPTQNVADIVKICILMWAGNNVTRPFRLAGAAALAPFMDKLMLKLQAKLKLPSKAAAFGLLVAAVAGTCFSILGALFFSRWVRG